MSERSKPFLYVVCAAGIADDVGKLITAAQERDWNVGVIATPQGLGFIDAQAVEAQTGYPIRSAWRSPGDPRPLPPPDAIADAPATLASCVRRTAWAFPPLPCPISTPPRPPIPLTGRVWSGYGPWAC